MKVTTVEQARALSRAAVETYGIPEQISLEDAGLAAAAVVGRILGDRRPQVAVVCGLGRTGGAGLVVARKLHSDGAGVRVLVTGDPERLEGVSRSCYDMVRRAGIAVVDDAAPEQVAAACDESDAVVDALLGTGLAGEVSGRLRSVVEAINRSSAAVLSLDLPSGVGGDDGLVRGVAVAADATIAFGLPKLGNLLYPGARLCGRLFVSHAPWPPALRDAADVGVEVSAPPLLPPRQAEGHKGSFGDVLFVAGAAGYFGAPSLAALSLLKAGGGYSRLAAPRSVVPYLAGLASEVVFHPLDETASGSLASSAAPSLRELCARVDFVVVGPGLSLADETQRLVREIVPVISAPLLIDGDGLTAVAADLDGVRRRSGPTVLTPHLGEMARLTGSSTGALRRAPVEAVRAVAADLDAVVVLKGAHSLIGRPDGRVFINVSGNSGMGTAGSGDVLTGAIAAMVGLGLDLGEAVRTGVFLHGVAGDLAAESKGEDGLTARDVLEHLPLAVRVFREDHAELTRDCYGAIEVV